eukprot:CAMPEP_0198138288 /NCGR_PEP_ID=MMETSP1443-20131203/1702_1 /TAXON_ID=186043 /ORGANISM="Entomoneis sp., Strain CCMP2396" /LENGTH=434 /DNA_ID=CAMNT_0043799999 /DNA_START=96 /DNA_END=1400 /DNA_ORIENTATION=+
MVKYLSSLLALALLKVPAACGFSAPSFAIKANSRKITSNDQILSSSTFSLKIRRPLLESRVALNAVTLPTAEPAYDKIREAALKTWYNVRHNAVWHWRLVFGSFFSSLFIFRQAIDQQLIGFWHYLLTSQALPALIFRTDSWEWCWAITCFSVYIHAFGLADRAVKNADQKGHTHQLKKYRLQDRYEADKFRRKNERKQKADGAVIETQSSEIPPVVQSKWHWKAYVSEFWVYALPLIIWDVVAPRRHGRIGGFAPPTTMGILGGITGGLLIYDILFFCGHFLMHKIPFLYRNVHAKHHISKEVRACDIVRLSIGEEVLEVGFSIIALNVLGVHPVARSIYNMVITFLLTELHCGFDFPWTPQNVVPFGLATGSRRHHYHHRIGKHYYQKFFFHVDRIFGLFQRDDGSLDGDSLKADTYIPPSWQKEDMQRGAS